MESISNILRNIILRSEDLEDDIITNKFFERDDVSITKKEMIKNETEWLMKKIKN